MLVARPKNGFTASEKLDVKYSDEPALVKDRFKQILTHEDRNRKCK